MVQNRRRSDSLVNLSDHDLLIKNTVNIENLHGKFDSFLSIVDKKADSYHVDWIIGVLTLAIISFSGLIWQVNNSMTDIKSKIAVHAEILKNKKIKKDMRNDNKKKTKSFKETNKIY